MQTVKLNNGVEMPILGYGVYQIAPEEVERCVLDALEAGYRSIDTAQVYENEEGIGKAIAHKTVPREDLFITTKVWVSNGGYEKAKVSIEHSLRKLQCDYLDLILIHQPFNDYYGTYRAMTEAYRARKVRAIGVSNFFPDRLVDFCRFNEIVPAVNQVETHPFMQQTEAHKYMVKYGVQHESWGPFGEGRKDMFTNPVLLAIAKKYDKSVAQIILRWLIQRNIVVIPKSTHKTRMVENMDVFGFELAEADMAAIAAINENTSLFFSHYDPATVEYITDLVIG